MSEEYHDIGASIEVSADGLAIPRARALLGAIGKHRDFSVVRLLTRSNPRCEIIVVDVETDQVPPNNAPGIKYRERLALSVPETPRSLVEVRALRKTFPTLAHQNHVIDGGGPSLCLYFEPPISVARTWTPQTFLRRIQWWLEKTAKGELHPADQPVEQLFFASPFELVLPWNFAELRKNEQQRFALDSRGKRPDGGLTFFLHPIRSDQSPPTTSAACIELLLPAIVHGRIEREPVTLGELSEMFAKRGANLFAPLKATLAHRVGPAGIPIANDEPFTLFLLHVPILRTTGATTPDGITHRAFIVDGGALKLGADIGALHIHDKRYFNVPLIGSTDTPTAWQSTPLMPVDVLRENNRTLAQQQSGIANEGPDAVLIGAGSLGSAMLNLWSRSGWGRWTVIDKDHVKPHNLSRHTGYLQHVGQLKTATVAELHEAAIRDGTIVPVFGDACDFANEAILTPLKKAALVVDASTTLEYPRQASATDEVGRHISTFITPTGNSAVLLAEDSHREIRVRDLEAQYYRALIQENWGQNHLRGNLSTFWSGAGCRDISVVMPYSRITAHASTLAEQIPLAATQPDALIRIWDRNPESGAIAVRDISTHSARCLRYGNLHLYIDSGVEDQLRELRTASLPNETGGVLLGYYDFNIAAVIVVCGLPAPPDSKSSVTGFERGTAGLVEAVNEATRRTAGVVGYVGEWHSHPPGHPALQSRHDILQLCHLAFGMADDGLPALQLIVGEGDLQIYQAMAIT